MHSSAKERFVEYLREFEGFANWMYLDSRGLVSTGIGILLDPYETYCRRLCKNVSWYDKDPRQKASDAELQKEFELVKSKNGPAGAPVWTKDPATNFASYRTFEPITRYRLNEADVVKEVLNITAIKESSCRQYFGPAYDTYPADVQVVLTQMAYGGGLAARKDDLKPLLAARDWLAARQYTYLTNPKQGKDGYKKYNACFERLMLNAHIVESCVKIASPKYPTPKNIQEFYGYTNALYVSRWNSAQNPQDLDITIRDDDVITGGDITPWLRRQR